ncbi:cyclic nucleotide-binding domain protein (macronuclear) [Tetrahymena thermophila SB210]|uniref:Cyclic nucleotide-binding domain protein n=1 Tax=Tetrahymena thermophila (strain SB210) TaxID=312017 RepID=I7LX34_TETTS|nr:cyclic nucleotide-binding domain protein [Tetrahymena thermophila SB210]EAS03680.2 cyclic nucleotide-binding domain protein [Tetrahymena thermophila SB210]|eukprot:XP_001023925.2 cyclic nucleotide-binding domain protein [Tetrahymena thermophila SB210]
MTLSTEGVDQDKNKLLKVVIQTLSYQKEDRNSEDIQILKEYFKNFKIFKDIENQLPQVQYNLLFGELKLEYHKKHKAIFRYGDACYKYYILLSGSAYLLKPTSQINEEEQIGQEKFKSISDEQQKDIQSIIENYPNKALVDIITSDHQIEGQVLNQKVARNSALVCCENTYVASLNSDAYHFIVEKYFSNQLQEKIEFLRKFPFLQIWSNAHLSNLLQTIKVCEYIKNQIVYTKNDPIQYIYLIKSGEFEIVQDIQADYEEPEQPMECYKQSIEEFYESFNMLNLQFKRTKKKEIQKKQKIVLLSSGQSFGLSEVAQHEQKRQETAICTSIKAEVYLLDKQVYLNSIKDKNNNELAKEYCLKQQWRNQYLENSKNLFQQLEYRKYSIQTNRSLRQIKGLLELGIDVNQENDQVNQKSSNQINSKYISALQTPTNSETQVKIKGFSSHCHHDESPKQYFHVKTELSREEKLSEQNSLSPRFEIDYLQENNKDEFKNNQMEIKSMPTKIIKNNISSQKSIKQFANLLNKSIEEKGKQNSSKQQANITFSNLSNQKSQKAILSTILKSMTNKSQSNSKKDGGFFSGLRISEFNSLQKSKQQNSKEELTQKFESESNLLKNMATSPKNFYEEELMNRLTINMNEQQLKKKNKQAEMLKQQIQVQNEQKKIKGQEDKNKIKLQIKELSKTQTTLTGREKNGHKKISQSPKKITFKVKKQCLEAIRSDKLDSANSLDLNQLFHTSDLKDRFQQMVQIENQMSEQYSKIQSNQNIDQEQKSKDNLPSSQSLKCFEKDFKDAQQLVNKRLSIDSLSQKQYFENIKKALNINRQQVFKNQIIKRMSIQPPPSIPIYMTLTSSSRQAPSTPKSTNSKQRLSIFFPTPKHSESNNQGLYFGNQSCQYENYQLQEQNQTNQIKKSDHEKSLTQRKNEDIFQYLIHRENVYTKNESQNNERQLNEQQILEIQNAGKNRQDKQIQTSEQKLRTKMEDLCQISQINEVSDQMSNNDNINISLNKFPSKQYINLQIKSPKNRFVTSSSLNQKQCDNKGNNSPNSNKNKKKPFIIDYNFVDSSGSSRYSKVQPKLNLDFSSYTSRHTTHLENTKNQQNNICKPKYKKQLHIDCEDKTPNSQQQKTPTPSKALNSQANESNSNSIYQQIKQETDQSKTPINNTVVQFEQSTRISPFNGAKSQVITGGFSNKSTASSSRPHLFKKDVIEQQIQQSRPTSKQNQKIFLFELLNKNQYQNGDPIKTQNNVLPQEIPLQPYQKQLYKFQESYYKSPINKSIITAYSQRNLVFKTIQKEQNKSLKDNCCQGNSIILQKNAKSPTVNLSQIVYTKV